MTKRKGQSAALVRQEAEGRRKRAYIERVLAAVDEDNMTMDRRTYIEALEEIAADLDGRLDAAREELAHEGA